MHYVWFVTCGQLLFETLIDDNDILKLNVDKIKYIFKNNYYSHDIN